jgi:hypothetical protein
MRVKKDYGNSSLDQIPPQKNFTSFPEHLIRQRSGNGSGWRELMGEMGAGSIRVVAQDLIYLSFEEIC